MIKGIHAMFYTPQADELRAFFRDKLKLDYFDVHDGWLIFPIMGEIGCHPDEQVKHEISLYCDDIEATVAELKGRGVEFTQEVEDYGWGLGTFMVAPGGMNIQLYQPRYGKP
jgi:hypothetical protein